MNLKPTGNRILVRLTPKTETVQGGIYIPASTDKGETREGTVIEVGRNVIDIEVGHRVLVLRWGGTDVKLDEGYEAVIVEVDSVLAILE